MTQILIDNKKRDLRQGIMETVTILNHKMNNELKIVKRSTGNLFLHVKEVPPSTTTGTKDLIPFINNINPNGVSIKIYSSVALTIIDAYMISKPSMNITWIEEVAMMLTDLKDLNKIKLNIIGIHRVGIQEILTWGYPLLMSKTNTWNWINCNLQWSGRLDPSSDRRMTKEILIVDLEETKSKEEIYNYISTSQLKSRQYPIGITQLNVISKVTMVGIQGSIGLRVI